MWGLGKIRDGAAGLVKQGAGAVKQGVEAGAKMLENLEEVSQQSEHHVPLDARTQRNVPRCTKNGVHTEYRASSLYVCRRLQSSMGMAWD